VTGQTTKALVQMTNSGKVLLQTCELDSYLSFQEARQLALRLMIVANRSEFKQRSEAVEAEERYLASARSIENKRLRLKVVK
jgi:hypothetical protein